MCYNVRSDIKYIWSMCKVTNCLKWLRIDTKLRTTRGSRQNKIFNYSFPTLKFKVTFSPFFNISTRTQKKEENRNINKLEIYEQQCSLKNFFSCLRFQKQITLFVLFDDEFGKQVFCVILKIKAHDNKRIAFAKLLQIVYLTMEWLMRCLRVKRERQSVTFCSCNTGMRPSRHRILIKN